MDSALNSQSSLSSLLAVYQSVCERQRVSLVRNAALVQDLERARLHLSPAHSTTRLDILKAKYNDYLTSVYPNWLSQHKSSHGNTCDGRQHRQFKERHLNSSCHDSSGDKHPTEPVSSLKHPPSSEVQSPHRSCDVERPRPTSNSLLSINTQQPGPLNTHKDADTAVCSAGTFVRSLSPLVVSSPPEPLRRGLNKSDVPFDLTVSSFSLTPSRENLSLMKAPPCTDSTVDEPSSLELHSPVTSTPSPPHTQQASTPLLPHTSTPSLPHTQQASTHLLPHTSTPSPPHTQQASTHLLPYISTPSPPHTQQASPPSPPHVSTPALPPGQETNTPSASPPHTGTPSPPHTQQASTPPLFHANTPSPPPTQQASTPPLFHANTPSPPHSQQARSSTADLPFETAETFQNEYSPRDIAHKNTSPVSNVEHSASLQDNSESILSLSHEETQPSFEPKVDRLSVVRNLLNTLNTHLNEDGDSIAMEIYSEPQDSDGMKIGISGSHVLANYVLKAAAKGGDTSTWDPSSVGVVLLQQLGLMTSSLGGALSEHLIREDAPLITHSDDISTLISPTWSSVWGSLMEHIQLLYNCHRPLDELAATFTPALVVTSNPIIREKACLQLLSILQQTIQRSKVTEEERSKFVEDEGEGSSDDRSLSQPLNEKKFEGGGRGYLGLTGGHFDEGSSEGSDIERELQSAMTGDYRETPAPQTTPLSQDISGTETSPITTPSPTAYVPTALENSAPFHGSQPSNNSSLRRRLGFYDNSDSELSEGQADLLTPTPAHVEDNDDFDFYG